MLLQLARPLNGFLLLLPVRGEAGTFFLEIGELFVELLEAFARRLVAFLAQGLTFDFELHDASLELVEFDGHRVDFHAELGGRLVYEIDGLVRQKSIGDVPVRQHGRGHERRILELHAVVDLVPLPEAAQDADGVLDGRLADGDRLEPSLERGVLFDVLAILVECRRTDRVELATRQHGLQHVRRIDRTFGGAGSDHRVQLVDEENDLSLGVGDLLEDRLQPFFEFAAILRAGDQRAHVERHDALALQAFGNVAADDAPRESLDDGRLADARLADEHRVVLRAARQHLDHAADLFVAADDRVQLARDARARSGRGRSVRAPDTCPRGSRW